MIMLVFRVLGFRVHEDVVNVENVDLVDVLTQVVINEPLSCGGSISETKQHCLKLK